MRANAGNAQQLPGQDYATRRGEVAS